MDEDDLLAGILAAVWWKHDEDNKAKPQTQTPQQTAAKFRWNAVVGEHLDEDKR